MFVLIVLSHGIDGHFYEINGEAIRIDDVVARFDGTNCPALVDKPKLFFIQACQGGESTVRSHLGEMLVLMLVSPYSDTSKMHRP